jgi:hypothetical protein
MDKIITYSVKNDGNVSNNKSINGNLELNTFLKFMK